MKLTAIDLFSGCGGFTEGFLQSKKFKVLAHIDWEQATVETLRANLIARWNYSPFAALHHVIHFDLQEPDYLLNGHWTNELTKTYGNTNASLVRKKGLLGLLQHQPIDVIIGGPPCQAYSLAGRSNISSNDYRNYLFESFVRMVAIFKPKVFVLENVVGLLSAKLQKELIIDRIGQAFKEIGYQIRPTHRLKDSIYSASQYGVPQDRKRVIIFGVPEKSEISVEAFYTALNHEQVDIIQTVQDAIGHLPHFRPLDAIVKDGRHQISHVLVSGKPLSYHDVRYHNKRDIRIFKYWLTHHMNQAPTQDKLKLYESATGKKTNHNKYRSLEWDKPSPTIVAHLHKDGLMFIHPDIKQLRTITVLEAALLQSFPDDYIFKGSMADCYTMIGNAVPVLLSKAIAKAISHVLA